jgi:outer membrane lipoprotein-sorting protein
MSSANVSPVSVFLAMAGAFILSNAGIAAAASMSAPDIVNKNIAARGGLAAWRGVQTLSWKGKMDAGGHVKQKAAADSEKTDAGKSGPAVPATAPTAQAQLPFYLELKRPAKSRLEIEFKGETAVQVYDGTAGWKLRPFLNRHEVESLTAEELKTIKNQAELDGYLMDYAAKGTQIDYAGIDKVDGKDAYKLKLTLKNRQVLHEWIDAKSFLEVKVEGTPRRLDNRLRPVYIYLRDYKPENGLMMPHLIETSVQGVAGTERIQIEKVVVNPTISDARFTKPS